jgi:hypothetical protein
MADIHQRERMTELWTAEKAAAYWRVSVSRARAILASRKIKRVSGYPADQVKAVKLRQGARTDLAKRDQPDGDAQRRRTATAASSSATATPK